MVMWYWYGFVDDDTTEGAGTVPATDTSAASNPLADKEVNVFDLDVNTVASGREFLATRSFSHTGSVNEHLNVMSSSSSSATLLNEEEFTNTPASAPAFSSLSLDAADMDTARMRRAKYWLQK